MPFYIGLNQAFNLGLIFENANSQSDRSGPVAKVKFSRLTNLQYDLNFIFSYLSQQPIGPMMAQIRLSGCVQLSPQQAPTIGKFIIH